MQGNALGLVALLFAVTAPPLKAEIYRWVDAQGNVHFGDKPLDAKDAARARQVELGRSYTPTQRSTQEQTAYEREQAAAKKKAQARSAAQEKASREQLAVSRDRKARTCAADKEKLKRVTEWETTQSGGRRMYYLTDDDGNAMSVNAQKAAVAELREKIAREC